MLFRGICIACLVCAGFIEAADPSAAQTLEAQQLLVQGRTADAIALLRQIARANPTDPEPLVMLGSALALRGDRSEAIEQTVRAVKLAPEKPALHNALGTILSRFGDFDAATQAFEEALRLDPAFADAHVNLGLLLATRGDMNAAAEHLDRAIEILGNSPAAATAHCFRAKIFSEQGDFENAKLQLEEAVRLRPDYADAWSELGATRSVLLDDAGALTALERSIGLNPNDAVTQYRLGSQYLRAARWGEASVHLERALRLGYDRRPVLYKLQRALRFEGRNVEANRAEEELKRLEPTPEDSVKAVALNNEGVAMEKTGDIRKALEKYRQAVDLDPAHNGFRLNYGLALCRLNQWREGITELQEVTRRDPDNVKASRALFIAKDEAARAQASPVSPK